MDPNQQPQFDPRQQPQQQQGTYQPYGNPNAPVQQPEVYNSPTSANVPYGAQPAPQPQPTVTNPQLQKTSKLPIIIGVLVGIFLIVATVTFLLTGGEKTNDQQALSPDSSTTPTALEPAQAIELEQTNTSLTQDLSGLDDEKDFPANSLDDKTLGL